MTDHELRMMMLDIDGVLTRHHADTTDVLSAAQQMAVSAVGDLRNHGGDTGNGGSGGDNGSGNLEG